MRVRNLRQYRDYLKRLHYQEYAHDNGRHARLRTKLDLSLWNDTVPKLFQEAALRVVGSSGAYHFSQDAELVELLADRYGYPKGQISIAAGADDALRIASRYCIRPGDKVLIPAPSFGRYEYHALINEASVERVNFGGSYPYAFDVAAIVKEANKRKVSCVILGNPNNPTGSALSVEEVDYLVRSIPASIILDESLMMNLGPSPHAGMVQDHYDNLFVCGSFSKLYGLAGLRIGYLVAPENHQKALSMLLSPFEVDIIAIELAKCALKNTSLLRDRVRGYQESIEALRDIHHPDVRVSYTAAPIALIELVTTQRRLYNFLRDNGIITVDAREFWGLDKVNGVRIIVRGRNDVTILHHILQRL